MNSSMSFILLVVLVSYGESQRTILDTIINISAARRTLRRLFNTRQEQPSTFEYLLRQGKLQRQISSTKEFFCDIRNTRSPVPPQSVHELRPGDIDIVGAMGDSLTAGNGILATNILHIDLENRGVSWSIGGQDNWRKFLTIPNILKEFNPNLYGYSLGDALGSERDSVFNVAEPAAMSRDMPYMAKVLIQRLKHDPKVNMTHHWKLVTLFIGSNDFCSDMCYYDRPEEVIDMHERDLVLTLRRLRDNIPRLMVNVLATPNLRLLTELQGKPGECEVTHRFECPCLIGTRFAPYLTFFTKIMRNWVQKQKDVISREEFNREDFTVNYQPFTTRLVFPRISKKYDDFRYLSTDCFHLSQKGQAAAANAMWNNMLEPDNQKSTNWSLDFEVFKCPSEKRPFLVTRENSERA